MTGTDSFRHPITAAVYDGVMLPGESLLGIGARRRRLLRCARGRVLEIGFGTGLNLAHYPDVTELVAVEPDPAMLGRARARVETHLPTFPVELLGARAEELPLTTASFDTVVVTLTLCSVQDPLRAISEAARVLRRDGRLVLLEHIRSDRPAAMWIQHAATPVWRHLAAGCHLDRPTVETIQAVGFDVDGLHRSGGGRGSFVHGVATLPSSG